MHRRDKDIAKIAEQIADMKATLRDRQKLVAEHNSFLAQAKNNNKQIELSISAGSRSVEKARTEVQMRAQTVRELQHEAEITRNELNKACADKKKMEREANELAKISDHRQQQVIDVEKDVEEFRAHMENEFGKTDELEMNAKRVDEMYKETAARLQTIQKEERLLKEQMFRESQKLYAYRKQEADVMADISGTQASLRNMHGNVSDLDDKSLKQQEMLYNIEFQIQQLERKVTRASGKRTHEETIVLNSKIEELSKELAQEREKLTTLTTQVKRIQDGLRAARREVKGSAVQKSTAHEKIIELEMENESAVAEKSKLEKERDDQIVENDNRLLDVKKTSNFFERTGRSGLRNGESQAPDGTLHEPARQRYRHAPTASRVRGESAQPGASGRFGGAQTV
eukprot:742152_1